MFAYAYVCNNEEKEDGNLKENRVRSSREDFDGGKRRE